MTSGRYIKNGKAILKCTASSHVVSLVVVLLLDVNERMSYECSDEGHILRTFMKYLLVHIDKKRKIALEIAANVANVNGPLNFTGTV
jgi:hypothetical protein